MKAPPKPGNACGELAKRNGVTDRLDIKGHCSVEDLRLELANDDVDLLIVDIEGGELDVLDPVRIPALKTVPMIVGAPRRLHPRVEAGTSEAFRGISHHP